MLISPGIEKEMKTVTIINMSSLSLAFSAEITVVRIAMLEIVTMNIPASGKKEKNLRTGAEDDETSLTPKLKNKDNFY